MARVRQTLDWVFLSVDGRSVERFLLFFFFHALILFVSLMLFGYVFFFFLSFSSCLLAFYQSRGSVVLLHWRREPVAWETVAA